MTLPGALRQQAASCDRLGSPFMARLLTRAGADHWPAGSALTLRLWPGDLTIELGRADFHGRWVRWNA
ncbi:hypothetical protein [Antarcticimicrobium luteum]|uniref:Uncharacterized protein n=1 Tax=Antarcticimicrobium luteum TaxID=2547397 RepID=A0A4R5UQS6_9RHOB|nr:hypothetical protein [Antarcticimicrobium luteum]TDK41408.1 hypothetical protein E1832_22275 [Antarcticimicrobium luteum]